MKKHIYFIYKNNNLRPRNGLSCAHSYSLDGPGMAKNEDDMLENNLSSGGCGTIVFLSVDTFLYS